MCNQLGGRSVAVPSLAIHQTLSPVVPALESVLVCLCVRDFEPELVCIVDEPDACETDSKL